MLGDDVDIEISAYDETNTVIPIKRIIRQIKSAESGFVGLVGGQSNQFPRAVDIARQFRDAGLPVVIGGFHVSGCLAMLPELPPDIKAAQEMGVSFYAGEAEGRFDEVLRDVFEGRLKPLYNYLSDLPDMSHAAAPFLPRKVVVRAWGRFPVQFLHHYQRTGPQVPIPHARRRRGHYPRQRGPGDQPLLHHRRQFRPQQALGIDPGPHDRPARERGFPVQVYRPG